MTDTIQDNKFVELNYKVLDKKTGQLLSTVEFPISYVHGADQVLATMVTDQLVGRVAGDVIEVPIDGNLIYGPRDENLVFTDRIENVPEEFREVGMKILMENEKVEQLILAGMPGADVMVTGDGRHFEARVVSEEFAGKSLIQRHRLVMETVKQQIASDELHALSIKTFTPDEMTSNK